MKSRNVSHSGSTKRAGGAYSILRYMENNKDSAADAVSDLSLSINAGEHVA